MSEASHSHSPATLSAAAYRETGFLELERKRIFAQSWQLIAHEGQVRKIGDYFAATVAGYPLIVVRGEDGIVRAFHNVCRHRAGPLADDGPGSCQGALVCRYHGWRYRLDGRLANARDFGPAQGFDPREYALHQIKCEIWRGFIFVNMNRDAEGLEGTVAPFSARTVNLPLEEFQFERRTTHDISCNWKTYVENYLEGYHIPLVHPILNSAVDASKYEVEVDPPVVVHHAPPRTGSPVGGLWAWLWPCLGINVYADGILMERIWPVSTFFRAESSVREWNAPSGLRRLRPSKTRRFARQSSEISPPEFMTSDASHPSTSREWRGFSKSGEGGSQTSQPDRYDRPGRRSLAEERACR